MRLFQSSLYVFTLLQLSLGYFFSDFYTNKKKR